MLPLILRDFLQSGSKHDTKLTMPVCKSAAAMTNIVMWVLQRAISCLYQWKMLGCSETTYLTGFYFSDAWASSLWHPSIMNIFVSFVCLRIYFFRSWQKIINYLHILIIVRQRRSRFNTLQHEAIGYAYTGGPVLEHDAHNPFIKPLLYYSFRSLWETTAR